MKRRFFFPLLSILFGLLLSEIFLRTLGIGFVILQEANNIVRAPDQPILRILAVGESTTADNANGFDVETWPRQLEKMLAKSGIPAVVFNEGRTATTSAHILSRMPGHLLKYRPEIVISMMGVNDGHFLRLFPPSEESGIRSFRLFRLSRLFYFLGKDFFDTRPKRSLFWDLPSSKKIIQDLKVKPFEAVWPTIEFETRSFDRVQRAQYYDFLGQEAEPELVLASERFMNSFKLYEHSLSEYFEVKNVAEKYVYLMSKVKDFRRCKEILKKYIAEIGPLNETFLMKATACRAAAPDDDELLTLLSKNAEGLEVKPGFDNPDNTRENYLALSQALSSRKITHIAMQYPLRDVQKLKSFYAFAPPEIHPFFVGNQTNFQIALEKSKYKDLFTDHFAGDFGHTTTEGHRLIAISACNAVLSALKELGRQNLPDYCTEE